MNTTIDVIGVYRVQIDEPVHLIEIWVRNSKGIFDLSEITQEIPDQSELNWQVPWGEKILDRSGKKVIADCFSANERPELWVGDIRMIFFFHHIDFSKPLATPFGHVSLLNETLRPNRLSNIEYEPPD